EAEQARRGVAPGGGAEVGAVPGDLGHAVAVLVLADQEAAPPQDRIGARQRDGLSHELGEIGVGAGAAPIEPAELVVLAVGVVVAALRAEELVAAEQHRRPAGKQQQAGMVLGEALAQAEDLGVIGLALGPAVPGIIVVGAV